MRFSTTLAVAIGLGALAACQQSAEEQRAENVVENAEMEAENIMDAAENRAENLVESAENRAENMTDDSAADTDAADTNLTNSY